MNPYHRLREGSFRGVRFQVAVSAEDETGRRVAIHRYPQRDDAFPEDLGRKSEPFNVEAIIVGADYLARADELFRACGEAGAGELVHPWLGARRVACLTCSRSFTSREGGMARFRLTFILAGQNRYPASVAGAGAPTAAAAETARAAAIGDFARRFVTTGVGSFALNNALALARLVIDVIGLLAGLRAPGGVAAASGGATLTQSAARAFGPARRSPRDCPLRRSGSAW